MKFKYGEYDGHPFPTSDSLFPSPKVIKLILQYGQDALDALNQLDQPDEQDMVQELIDAGLLERDEKTGALRLTPKLLRGIEHRALMEVFANLRRGNREGHQTTETGRSDEPEDGTKPYEFGDPLSQLDMMETMRNAVRRTRQERGESSASVLPLQLNGSDLEIHLTDGHADVATCILLDMSGSMMRYGRFYQAKRVALGLAALVRNRFPQDTVDYAGFYSLAHRIPERDLPLVMPKPITVHSHQVGLRVPLQQAQDNPRLAPQHFTNLQLGLRLARQMLSRRPAANKQIFIITDGQPTAHVEPASGGAGGVEMLHLIYPPSEHTSMVTLQEALRCHQQGIRIATFALIEDYWGMEWVGFVDQLTRLTRGLAYYCASDDLSSLVIESYLTGRRSKKAVS